MAVNSLEPISPAGRQRVEYTHVGPAKHIVSAQQGDRTILLDVHRGHYYSLDGVGSQIWAMLQDGMELHQIEERLVGEYAAPREQIVRDLSALVEQLRRKALVS